MQMRECNRMKSLKRREVVTHAAALPLIDVVMVYSV